MLKSEARVATDPLCPCCGARRWRSVHADIAGCAECGYQRMEPLPADVVGLYDEGYFTGQKYHDYPADKRLIQATFVDRLRALRRWLKQPPADLDLYEVGSAYGYFLEVAAPHFRSVRGIDVAAVGATEGPGGAEGEVARGDFLEAPLPARSVDVLCMWDTIEHLLDPWATVAKAFEVLRPGGVFAATTGDVEAALPRLQGRKWRLYDPPFHVHYFSPHSLSTLLFNAGFRVLGHETCPTVHSVDQVVHGLATHGGETPGVLGRLCRRLDLPEFVRQLNLPLDLRDIFMIVAEKP
ncbi:MAG: class I SAM-dependent methyltransferase [Armatimonadetes bacterium]|nr:class I SAM-dependent methyltransferase [Armatimonadota bacterium]